MTTGFSYDPHAKSGKKIDPYKDLKGNFSVKVKYKNAQDE